MSTCPRAGPHPASRALHSDHSGSVVRSLVPAQAAPALEPLHRLFPCVFPAPHARTTNPSAPSGRWLDVTVLLRHPPTRLFRIAPHPGTAPNPGISDAPPPVQLLSSIAFIFFSRRREFTPLV